MKKIALNFIYLSEQHAGGKDQVGLNLLRGLYELGYSSYFFVICYDFSIEVIKNISPDIQIVSIKPKFRGNELMRMADVSRVNTFIIPGIIKREKAILIYHSSCNNGFRKFKIPSVTIPHDIKAISHRTLSDLKIPFYKYYIYKIMYAVDFKNADFIIAISDFDKKDIESYYPKRKDKIHRIYNPIITENLQIKTHLKKRYICALNLQFHHKNIITLIKAFESIKDQVKYNLVLIGKVPQRVIYLKKYVREHNLENRVRFTGFIDDERVNSLFSQCILYVNPSMYEGFGMTAVEAIIKKVPTLLSKIPAHYEVTKGLASYYEPIDDYQALASAILKCLDNRPTPSYLEKAKQRMIEEYDYLNIAKQYYTFFLNIIEKK